MPEILLNQSEGQRPGAVSSGRVGATAGRVFTAAGVILVLGAIVDLVALWVFQRQDTVQWEFVALGTTTNTYPVLVISAALFYGALAMSGSDSRGKYRLAAGYVLVLGLFALTIGFLIGTNYLAVQRGARVTAEAAPVFKSLLMKSGGTSLLIGVVMTVVGVLGLRTPKSAGA